MVALGTALALAVLTGGFNLALRSNLEADADRVLKARASAALEEVSIERDGLRLIEPRHEATAPDSPIWIYSGPKALERGQGPIAVQRLADSLATRPGSFEDDPDTHTRLYSEPIQGASRAVGTVVSALSVEPYERTESRALIFSLLFGLAVFALVILGTRIVIARALQPVVQMTEEAAAWSERDLDQRFNLGEPSDELMQLGATFDRLLDRIANSLRHERRFSAEISHEMRTPLAAVIAETELALNRERGSEDYREALRRIASRASQLRQTLEALLAAARADAAGAPGSADAIESAARVIEVLSEISRSRGLRVRIDVPPTSAFVDADPDALDRIISPIVENACRYAQTAVTVSLSTTDGRANVLVVDDGPGLDPAELEAVFEPGKRGTAAIADGVAPGAGLGLALARRLARALGGEITALAAASGARFEIVLPLARGPRRDQPRER